MPEGFGYGPDAGKKKKGGPQMGHSPTKMGHSPAKMGHSPNEMGHSPMENQNKGYSPMANQNKGYAKQERKDLMNDNPVARDASGGRPWIARHFKSTMGSPAKMGHSPMEKHDGKKFEDKGFMDSHFPSGAPRK